MKKWHSRAWIIDLGKTVVTIEKEEHYSVDNMENSDDGVSML